MRLAIAPVVLAVVAVVMLTAGAETAEPTGDAIGLFDAHTAAWSLPDVDGGLEHFVYGQPGDTPLVGDWDCDGIDTVGVYSRSAGLAFLRDMNSAGGAGHVFYVGDPGDVPLAGDFNGDGCDTVSVYRPTSQAFYVFHRLAANGARLGLADSFMTFGNPGDKPVVGDWDGDGVDEFGLHRESTGFFYWRLDHASGIAHGQIYYGDPGDRLVAGDWGIVDGNDSLAVLRPTEQRLYVRHRLSAGFADQTLPGGGPTHTPVAGNFGDVPESPWSGPIAGGIAEIPELSRQLAALMNRSRVEVCGTHPLAVRAHLGTVPAAHSIDMAANGFFSHLSPTRGGLGDRLRAAGLSPGLAAENLAVTHSIETLVQAWLESPSHRPMFCDSRFVNVGVAVIGDGSGRLWGAHLLTD